KSESASRAAIEMNAQDLDGDVVRTATLIGNFDQFLAGLGGLLRSDNGFQFRLADLAPQTVGTENQNILALQRDRSLGIIGHEVGSGAERSGENMALRMAFRFF